MLNDYTSSPNTQCNSLEVRDGIESNIFILLFSEAYNIQNYYFIS